MKTHQHRSLRRSTLLLTLLSVASPGIPAVAADISTPQRSITEIHGEARTPGGDALLYAEQHYIRHEAGEPSERLVLYRCPDGQAFARKTVDYGDALQAPEFVLEDVRFGYREGFADGAGFIRRDAGSPEQREAIRAGAALVVDAGFDEFVRAKWDALQRGDKVALDFLIPSRLAAYGFKLQRLRSEQQFGESATVFRLSLSGMFGWFADAIDVSYRDSDRRLMRFEGLTNIRRDDGESHVARIEFPPTDEQAVDEARWQAAEAEPLAACTVGS